jgi:hypothetical protein
MTAFDYECVCSLVIAPGPIGAEDSCVAKILFVLLDGCCSDWPIPYYLTRTRSSFQRQFGRSITTISAAFLHQKRLAPQSDEGKRLKDWPSLMNLRQGVLDEAG